MTDKHRDRVDAWINIFWADVERKTVKSRDLYLRDFPGLEREIDEELTALAKEDGGSVAPVAPLGKGGASGSEPRIGPYRRLKELGRGGQGCVYLAEDTRLGRRVALKVLSPGYALSATALLRFRAEAERAAKVNHPGLAQLYEWGGEEDQPYLAMEFVEGRTLAEHLRDSATVAERKAELSEIAIQYETKFASSTEKVTASGNAATEHLAVHLSPKKDARRSGGRPTTATEPSSGLGREAIAGMVSMIESAARALHAAHEAGLVHRDIKPGNMMMTKDRGLVIIDFGLASDEDAHGASLTMTGDLLGTPAYMSPEQWDTRRIRVDRRSDVYSLGVTLYECLALRRPFQAPSREQLYLEVLSKEAPNLHKLNPAVSEDLRVIVACAMEKDADRRYQTALEFAEDLRRLREYEPIHARPVGPIGRLTRWSQRNPAVAALLATVLLALTAGFLWTTFKNRELSEVNRELERTTEEARRNAAEAQQNAIKATRNAQRAEEESAAKSLALEREQRALASVSEAFNEKASALEREQRALASVSEALNEKASALAEYERMADARRLLNAQRDAEALWPVHPDLVPKLKAWQTKHEALFASLPDHERALQALRERALPYTEADRARDFTESLAKIPELEKQGEELSKSVADAKEEPARKQAEEALSKLQSELVRLREEVSGQKTWSFGDDVDLEFRHEALSVLVSALSAALDPKSGVVASIADRLEQSARIATETVTQHQALWTAAKERIAAHPAYAGLLLKPQTGLIPLGPDPTSGLEEFLHWQTHDWKAEGSVLPVRSTDGRMVMTAGRGVILVLIPGGTFRMGAQKSDPNKPNYDPEARDDESPVHEVPLAPYFLSKYEMTQGQWLRFTGENPSNHGVGWKNPNIQKGAVDARHPVEMVSFDDAQKVLPRLGLELPTEAQWERAARAGASTIWAQTSTLAELGRFGNISGAEAAPYFTAHTAAHRDPFVIHAPAGAFLANAYGLHDMTGNVFELCRDGYRGYDESPREGDGLRGEGASRDRVPRGGSFFDVASHARVALRSGRDPSVRLNVLGFRPSRRITPD